MSVEELHSYKLIDFIVNKRCDLSNLNLVGIDTNLFTFTHLEELLLSENHLKHLSDEIANLTNLKILQLSDNRLTDLPDIFDKLQNLEQLYLSGNKLHFLPNSIVSLKNLKWLSLADNNELYMSEQQKIWLDELKKDGCKILNNMAYGIS